MQQSFLTRRLDIWNEQNHHLKHWSLLEIGGARNSHHGKQRVSPFYHGSELCFQRLTIRSHRSRAGLPSNLNPASKRDDFRFCWTVRNSSLFLTHTTYGNKCMTSKNAQMFLQKSILHSSRSPAKSESWNSPSLHCLAELPTWQYCLFSQVWWINEINRFRRLSQALVHFVMDRASLFTDHRISSLPIRAKYKHFRTIWEHTCENSPTDFISLKWWSSMHGVDTS